VTYSRLTVAEEVADFFLLQILLGTYYFILFIFLFKIF